MELDQSQSGHTQFRGVRLTPVSVIFLLPLPYNYDTLH